MWAAVERSYDIPLSQLKLERMKQFLGDWQNKVEALDFDEMGQDDRVDYLLFKNLLRHQLDRISREEARLRCRRARLAL